MNWQDLNRLKNVWHDITCEKCWIKGVFIHSCSIGWWRISEKPVNLFQHIQVTGRLKQLLNSQEKKKKAEIKRKTIFCRKPTKLSSTPLPCNVSQMTTFKRSVSHIQDGLTWNASGNVKQKIVWVEKKKLITWGQNALSVIFLQRLGVCLRGVNKEKRTT